MKKIIVLIPAYNEERNIGKVIAKIPSKILGIKTEILVIDDGSEDKTVRVAKKNGALVIVNNQNLGLGKTFQRGLNKALELKADYLVNIDGDGQFDPGEIEKLLKPIVDDEVDFVSADRFGDNRKMPVNMPKEKFWGNILMAKLVSFLTKQHFNDVSCGFRAYSRKAMLMLNLIGRFTYTQESFLDLASKRLGIKTVPIKVKYFKNRKSRIADNLIKYGWQTSKIIIRSFRDYRPLLFFIYLSVLPFLTGLASGIFILLYYINNGRFSPYKAYGFVSIYLLSVSLLLWIVGFSADMFVRLRMNQEKILYMEKLKRYEK